MRRVVLTTLRQLAEHTGANIEIRNHFNDAVATAGGEDRGVTNRRRTELRNSVDRVQFIDPEMHVGMILAVTDIAHAPVLVQFTQDLSPVYWCV